MLDILIICIAISCTPKNYLTLPTPIKPKVPVIIVSNNCIQRRKTIFESLAESLKQNKKTTKRPKKHW